MTYKPEDLLPHRSPMVLVSRVVAFDADRHSLVAETDISPESLFYDGELGGVPAYLSIEYMAQTIGCFAGYWDLSQTPPIPPRVGFVLGTRKFCTSCDVLAPGCYRITVKEQFFDNEIASFSAEVSDVDGNVVCSASLNAFRPANLDVFKQKFL